MAMIAMTDPKANAADVARRLQITTSTLYSYVNGDGSAKAAGQRVLDMQITASPDNRAGSLHHAARTA